MQDSPADETTSTDSESSPGGFGFLVLLLGVALFLAVAWFDSRKPSVPRLSPAGRAEAADICRKAREMSQVLTLENVAEAADQLDRCVERYPAWEETYLVLASLHRQTADRLKLPREAMQQAASAIHSLLELNPKHPAARAELALYKLLYDWDWTGAEAELQMALAGDPQNAEVRAWFARLLQVQGRLSAARVEVERALQKDQSRVLPLTIFAHQLTLEGNLTGARSFLQKQMTQLPGNSLLIYELAAVASEAGDHRQALDLLGEPGNEPQSLAWSGVFLAKLGETNQAMANLQKIKTLSRERYVSPFYPAIVCSALGRKREAFQHIGNAYTYRSPFIIGLKIDYPLKELAAEPRFRDMARRVGL